MKKVRTASDMNALISRRFPQVLVLKIVRVIDVDVHFACLH